MSDENTNNGEGEGIADLRKRHDELAKQNKAMLDELAQFRAEKRQASVADVLKAKGLPAKAASLYNGEDVSEDAVVKWASEYADVFGLKQEGAPAGDPNAANAQRVSDASYGAPGTEQFTPGTPIGDPVEALQRMKTLPYEELVKIGYLPDIKGTLFDPHGR